MTELTLRDLHLCFEGVIPAVVATAAADGTPNVTYLSRVRPVDDERIALSNQFFSKTARNLAENPRASMLIIDPSTYAGYRLTLVYERTEVHGATFEQLRTDVDAVAAVTGMQKVFKLRAADIYRVTHIEHREQGGSLVHTVSPPRPVPGADRLGEFTARLSRCGDLDLIVSTTVGALADLLGYEYSSLLLLDETGRRLYTIASHGYPVEGVGSEAIVGEGIAGMAASRATPILVGNLRQMARYGTSVRREYENEGEIGPGREIPAPHMPDAQSRIALPTIALGQVIGVLLVESPLSAAFTDADTTLLLVVATLVANAIEAERTRERADEPAHALAPGATRSAEPATDATHVRFFAVDGSVFLDGDYLIKGVAGRVLWSLLGHYDREGRVEFTNKEVRLDPTLELPEFRDNLDSRLILLKRRLDERAAPIRIEKTGRGRFRLAVDTPLRLDEVGSRDG